MVISSPDTRILFVSEAYCGKEHDYGLLKEVLPPNKDWFKNKIVRLDSGYHGFGNDYRCLANYLPHKRTKNRELTDAQKAENREGAKERIKVEHSIGGLKRFRILSDQLRLKDFDVFNEIIGVCAGLWNYSKINLND